MKPLSFVRSGHKHARWVYVRRGHKSQDDAPGRGRLTNSPPGFSRIRGLKQDVESPAATLSRKLLAAPRRVRAPCVSLRRARIHGEPSRRRRRMTTAAPRARSSVLISNPHDHPRSSPTALLHPPKKASRRRLTSTPRDDGRRESSTMIMLANRKNTRTSCYKQREKRGKTGGAAWVSMWYSVL